MSYGDKKEDFVAANNKFEISVLFVADATNAAQFIRSNLRIAAKSALDIKCYSFLHVSK